MKLFGCTLIFLTLGFGQTDIWQVPIWTGNHYIWPKLGPTFVIKDNVINVLPSPVPILSRHYCGQMIPVVNNTYPLPIGVTSVMVYKNGLRMAPDIDYQLKVNIITPLYTWEGSLVIADYELP